jgi:hypothetical protein
MKLNKKLLIYFNLFFINFYFIKYNKIIKNFLFNIFGDWGLGIGDWGLGIGGWGHDPIPNPQSPIPNPQSPILISFLNNKKLII